MFTVKATYINETRKFTFPESVLFPSYAELRNQLHRIFPITHDYYLSTLIFSPDALKPGRILVGKEVHSAEDYDLRVAPLRRVWFNPLLRFIIFEQTPDKTLTRALQESSLHNVPTAPLFQVTSPPPPLTCILPPIPQPCKASPSPPYPPTFSPSCERATIASAQCCPLAKGRADIQALLSSFKEDLEGILCRTLGTDRLESSSSPKVKESITDISQVDVPPPRTIPTGTITGASSRWCFVCKTGFTGIWYGCVKCPWHTVCPGCFSKSRSAHTLSFGPLHLVQQRSADSAQDTVMQEKEYNSAPQAPQSLPPPSPSSTGQATLPVHYGVVCDRCDKTVVGVRHKCLDCPNYDLCTTCVESGATEQHNPFHEFFDIEAPGRVYVHTVYGGDKHRWFENHEVTSGSEHVGHPRVRHSATCDLCDSAIVGERYKCIACPDFDTCSSCFKITMEQHPNHGFVKVNNPEDLMIRESASLRQIAHLAVCDACRKTIHGSRFKCMHPSCPDFDLCSHCEALPIPVHPSNHPMLKLRTPDTIIPSVYRIGEKQMINEAAHEKSPVICSKPRSPVLLSPESPTAKPVVGACQVPKVTSVGGLTPHAEEFLSPPCSPVSEGVRAVPSLITITQSHLVDVADPPGSFRPTHATLDIYHQLWPKVNQEMMRLNASEAQKAEDPTMEHVTVELVGRESLGAEESQLGSRTTSSVCRVECRGTYPASPSLSTKPAGDGYGTPSSIPSNDQELRHITQQFPAEDRQEFVAANVPRQGCLDSAFVGDTNVPDGQIFPPGAEFVKGWHMVNSGELSWPTTTEIQFVAGEMFSPERNVTLRAKVGAVYPGDGLDIWTGDLKAPDVPGRYVGYWRLSDGQGNFFGSSVWIDLTVADHHSDRASEHSLAASSMVMPSTHPDNSVDPSDGVQDAPQVVPSSTKTVTDEVEGPGSDISSVSLVSMPTSDDEDAEWQDTRTHSEPLEYVVLYDSHSDE